MRVGVIGLGVMGHPMARHLVEKLPAGSRVAVTGRSRAKAARLEPLGVQWVDTAAELAALVDTVIYVVPDLPQIRESLDGADGLLAGADHPLTVVVSSTTSPEGLRVLAAEAAERTDGRVSIIDAPISGGQEGAEAGTLSIMVGGPADIVTPVLPALATMGNPVHLGPTGAGQVAKACNQVIVAAQVVALSEASVIAERAGLDVLEMFTLLQGGYAGSRIMEVKKRRFAEHDHSPSGAAKFMIKDLSAALEEAGATRTATPLTELLLDVFTSVTDAGYGDQDTAVVQAWIEKRNA